MQLLCHVDEIEEGQSKGLQEQQQSFIAIKLRGQLFLYLNRCPHRGIPLEWQPDQFLDIEGRFIQCSTHGALFEIDSGRCIQGPCHKQSLVAVPFQLIDGMICIES